MKTSLLKYEFWKNKTDFYLDFFSKGFARKDRIEKRKFFAEVISEIQSDKIRWLDVGTGEGSKLIDIIKFLRKINRRVEIDLVIFEPSKYALPILKRKLSEIKGVNFKIRNEAFSYDSLKNERFDCISFFHSTYYLANSESAFLQLYRKAHRCLNSDGILMVQSVYEKGDFQELGKPKYSLWAQGEHIFNLFKRISKKACKKYFPERFEVTDFLRQKELKVTRKKLVNLYRFTKQLDESEPSDKELELYIRDMRKLAKSAGNRSYLDFKDVVVWLHKD